LNGPRQGAKTPSISICFAIFAALREKYDYWFNSNRNVILKITTYTAAEEQIFSEFTMNQINPAWL
jgi:hypothetical protein